MPQSRSQPGTKNPQGLDEIVDQDDVNGDTVKMIEDQVGMLKGVPADDVVDEEKKKGDGWAPECCLKFVISAHWCK